VSAKTRLLTLFSTQGFKKATNVIEFV